MSLTPKPRIVCAALMNDSGEIICGPRHYDHLMHFQISNVPQKYRGSWAKAEQGFVDQYGNFYTREAAKLAAEDAGQIIKRVGGDDFRLFSENLY